MESKSALISSLSLMRRLPPNQIPTSIAGLTSLIEDESLNAEILQRVDQPLGKAPNNPRNRN